MNREINIARNITNLRKKHKVTQEQLAEAVKVSPQAVSKWETASCQPDTLTLPLIADFFKVSIDYLYYGYEDASDDIYEQITKRLSAKTDGTADSFEDALKISAAAQHGIMHGMDEHSFSRKSGVPPVKINGLPMHLMDGHGLSVCTPKGFSAIITKGFVNSVNGKTLKRARKIFAALADEDCLRITTEILNFCGISMLELKEKTKWEDERLKRALEMGINAGFILQKPTNHAILGAEYFIQRHHYPCFLLLLSTIKMIELSLQGAQRMLYRSMFAMSFEEDGDSPSDAAE